MAKAKRPGRIPSSTSLAKQLCHSNKRLRIQAAATIASRGTVPDDALEPLLTLLNDPEKSVRLAAMEALSDDGPAAEAAFPSLLQALADDDPEIRVSAIFTLSRKGPSIAATATALAKVLGDDSHPVVRFAAAHTLSQIGPEASAACPALVAALRDEDEDVRFVAVTALTAIGTTNKEVVSTLIQALKGSKSLMMSCACIFALKRLASNLLDIPSVPLSQIRDVIEFGLDTSFARNFAWPSGSTRPSRDINQDDLPSVPLDLLTGEVSRLKDLLLVARNAAMLSDPAAGAAALCGIARVDPPLEKVVRDLFPILANPHLLLRHVVAAVLCRHLSRVELPGSVLPEMFRIDQSPERIFRLFLHDDFFLQEFLPSILHKLRRGDARSEFEEQQDALLLSFLRRLARDPTLNITPENLARFWPRLNEILRGRAINEYNRSRHGVISVDQESVEQCAVATPEDVDLQLTLKAIQATLDPVDVQVWELYSEGHSLREIAKILNLSRRGVSAAWNRVKRLVTKWLQSKD